MKKIFYLPLLSLFVLSCSLNSPKPCFELSCESLKQIDCILAGEEVLFSNCSDNGLSYSWDFGDGITSTLSSPRHAWETPGNYTVTLTVENEDKSKSATQEVVVSPSLYGIWEGTIQNGDEPTPFTLELEQSANKIKGKFTYAGSYRATGVLSSNSVLSGDSVFLKCALIYSFGEMTFSNLFEFSGLVNEQLDHMEGPQVVINNRAGGSWEASKKQ